MKKLVLLLLLACTAGLLNAQISIAHSYMSFSGTADGERVDFYTTLYNDSPNDLWLYWQRAVNVLPVPSWKSLVCIGELCYDDLTNSDNFAEVLKAGDSSSISCYIENDGTGSGVAHVRVDIFDPNDSATSNAYFEVKFHAWPVGTSTPDGPVVSLYPNPSHHTLTVDHRYLADLAFIRVVDMQGRLVMNHRVHAQADVTFLPVSNLAAGQYVVQLVGRGGNSLADKLIQKN
jgi:hypothetical protein